MNVFGVWKDVEHFNVSDGLLVSLIAIVIVFFILAILILVSELVNLGTSKLVGLTTIGAREENKILDEDPDAAVAVLVATIDFHKETGKDANVVSVTKIED